MAQPRTSRGETGNVHEINDIDRATTALYETICSSPNFRPFIRCIEGSEPLPLQERKPRILVMPGAFHVEHPHTGADGRRIFELAAELAWPAERVNVPSLAPMKENAAALVDRLRAHREPIVLVSLSKGGADVRAALQRPDAPAVFREVRAWVNLSGMVTGTPLVGWLKARPLRCLGARALLWFRRQRFAVIEEMRHGAGSPLDGPLMLPEGLRAIHVVGFPLKRDLSNDWAKRGHARLAPLGPNDGGGILLRDVLRWPGVVYPVWGCDHYLRPSSWDIRPRLLRILQAAAREPESATTRANAND
jgi:hypothetical protein